MRNLIHFFHMWLSERGFRIVITLPCGRPEEESAANEIIAECEKSFEGLSVSLTADTEGRWRSIIDTNKILRIDVPISPWPWSALHEEIRDLRRFMEWTYQKHGATQLRVYVIGYRITIY